MLPFMGAARRKNGLCERSTRGNWNPREGQQPFRPNPNWVGDRTTTMRWLLRYFAIAETLRSRLHQLSIVSQDGFALPDNLIGIRLNKDRVFIMTLSSLIAGNACINHQLAADTLQDMVCKQSCENP